MGSPIGLHLTGKERHRIRFNSNARDSLFLAFNEGRSSSAEWIENALIRLDFESLQVLTHQVRRKGEDEAIPLVSRSVLCEDLVAVSLGSRPGQSGNHRSSIH